jgi:hypothetical protein
MAREQLEIFQIYGVPDVAGHPEYDRCERERAYPRYTGAGWVKNASRMWSAIS